MIQNRFLQMGLNIICDFQWTNSTSKIKNINQGSSTLQIKKQTEMTKGGKKKQNKNKQPDSTEVKPEETVQNEDEHDGKQQDTLAGESKVQSVQQTATTLTDLTVGQQQQHQEVSQNKVSVENQTPSEPIVGQVYASVDQGQTVVVQTATGQEQHQQVHQEVSNPPVHDQTNMKGEDSQVNTQTHEQPVQNLVSVQTFENVEAVQDETRKQQGDSDMINVDTSADFQLLEESVEVVTKTEQQPEEVTKSHEQTHAHQHDVQQTQEVQQPVSQQLTEEKQVQVQSHPTEVKVHQTEHVTDQVQPTTQSVNELEPQANPTTKLDNDTNAEQLLETQVIYVDESIPILVDSQLGQVTDPTVQQNTQQPQVEHQVQPQQVVQKVQSQIHEQSIVHAEMEVQIHATVLESGETKTESPMEVQPEVEQHGQHLGLTVQHCVPPQMRLEESVVTTIEECPAEQPIVELQPARHLDLTTHHTIPERIQQEQSIITTVEECRAQTVVIESEPIVYQPQPQPLGAHTIAVETVEINAQNNNDNDDEKKGQPTTVESVVMESELEKVPSTQLKSQQESQSLNTQHAQQPIIEQKSSQPNEQPQPTPDFITKKSEVPQPQIANEQEEAMRKKLQQQEQHQYWTKFYDEKRKRQEEERKKHDEEMRRVKDEEQKRKLFQDKQKVQKEDIEVRKKLQEIKEIKNQVDNETPLYVKVGISAAASLAVGCATWFALKNKQFTALGSLGSLALAFIVQK